MREIKSEFNQSGIFAPFYNQTHFFNMKVLILILNNAKSLF